MVNPELEVSETGRWGTENPNLNLTEKWIKKEPKLRPPPKPENWKQMPHEKELKSNKNQSLEPKPKP